MKPIIDIWSSCIDDRDVFDNDKDLEITNIRLTAEEETDLYEILALDKVFFHRKYFLTQLYNRKKCLIHI